MADTQTIGPFTILHHRGADGAIMRYVEGLDKPTSAAHVCNRNQIVKAFVDRDRLRAAAMAVLERANGKLYDTDQATGETFDKILARAIEESK